jgi:hypothetical protein
VPTTASRSLWSGTKLTRRENGVNNIATTMVAVARRISADTG